jgi:hypothetical protein
MRGPRFNAPRRKEIEMIARKQMWESGGVGYINKRDALKKELYLALLADKDLSIHSENRKVVYREVAEILLNNPGRFVELLSQVGECL